MGGVCFVCYLGEVVIYWVVDFIANMYVARAGNRVYIMRAGE